MSAREPVPDLAAEIEALWQEFRPLAVRRVSTLEELVARVVAGAAREAEVAEALDIAHKLAGALGTYGRPDGSRAARAVEEELAARQPNDARLALALDGLRDAVSRPDPQSGRGA